MKIVSRAADIVVTQHLGPSQRRAGSLRPGSLGRQRADHTLHASFLTDWLRFVGVTDVTEIRFQPTILTPAPAEDRAAAHTAARNAAKVF
jgi:FMN-dependent NADH-azoreductase